MCAKFLERFVFPDFCTFRFSNRAHFVLPDSYKKQLTCIDNLVSTSISLPANNDKNLRYDIGQQEIHDLIKGQTWVKMSIAENKSEENDIKTPVLDRKNDYPSLFCGKTINFVRVCINNTGKYKSIFRTTHYAVLHNKRSQSPSLEQI